MLVGPLSDEISDFDDNGVKGEKTGGVALD